MKKMNFIMGLLLLTFTVKAQIVKPVKWSFTANSLKGKTGIYEVRMTAVIDKDWTTYSQWTPEGGPEPTVITFNKNPNVLLGGKVKEVGEMKKKHEEAFGVDVHYFSDKVDFEQLVKVKSDKGSKLLTGKVKYMTCDKEQCISDEVEFSVVLK